MRVAAGTVALREPFRKVYELSTANGQLGIRYRKTVPAMLKDQMEKIYRSLPPDKIPWNLEAVPDILQDIVKAGTINLCKVIAVGV